MFKRWRSGTLKDTLKVMDGTILEKAWLFFILENKARVSITNLPLFCAVFSLCFKICFSFFFKMFKDFLAHCCLIMPLLVNFLMLYFQSTVCTVLFTIPWVRSKAHSPKNHTTFRTNIFHPCITSIFITMHCLCFVCLSDKTSAVLSIGLSIGGLMDLGDFG